MDLGMERWDQGQQKGLCARVEEIHVRYERNNKESKWGWREVRQAVWSGGCEGGKRVKHERATRNTRETRTGEPRFACWACPVCQSPFCIKVRSVH